MQVHFYPPGNLDLKKPFLKYLERRIPPESHGQECCAAGLHYIPAAMVRPPPMHHPNSKTSARSLLPEVKRRKGLSTGRASRQPQTAESHLGALAPSSTLQSRASIFILASPDKNLDTFSFILLELLESARSLNLSLSRFLCKGIYECGWNGPAIFYTLIDFSFRPRIISF